ncbi:MAG: cryptochrome/photolyase family protein [Chloroflexi bacterium]|nr:cryptochrome/photolyase family protein [Chloroflexota bacterium]
MSAAACCVWILGDQLLIDHPALQWAEAHTAREQIRVVLIESRGRLQQLSYHRKKLVLLLSALRHYAETLRARGYVVDYVSAETFVDGLQQHVSAQQPDQLVTMAASEYATRELQSSLADRLQLPVQIVANTQFLVERHNPIPEPEPGKRYVMESFYRDMRRHYAILVTDDKQPVGGAWNFDKDNRQKLPKDAAPPPRISFTPDDITRQVLSEIAAVRHGVGSLDGFDLAVTHDQAQAALDDFLEHRLAGFGPYEDAMSSQHMLIYHSMLSLYINIGLIDPLTALRMAEAAYHAGAAPINSVEGFIRQILGWREFIYWQYWRQMPGLRMANSWGAQRLMPQMFWDGQTQMRCIQHVVERLLADGYSHHIERLMVICNYCLLAGVDPAGVADWFLMFYADAYEWVVLPNVIGMGLNADGGLTATKPYIASANYINKMSDYCKGCHFDHKQRLGEKACPYNFLYWNFIIEHEATLRANPRFGRSVLGLSRIDEAERRQIQAQADEYLAELEVYENSGS